MGDSVKVVKVGFSAVISEADWYANKNPATARAYLDNLAYVNMPGRISDSTSDDADSFDTTDEGDGGYASEGVGHRMAEGEVKFQGNQYQRPPQFRRGEIRAMRVFYDFEGTGLINTTPGSENVEFIGFVRIGKISRVKGQRGAIEYTVPVKAQGFFAGDFCGLG